MDIFVEKEKGQSSANQLIYVWIDRFDKIVIRGKFRLILKIIFYIDESMTEKTV